MNPEFDTSWVKEYIAGYADRHPIATAIDPVKTYADPMSARTTIAATSTNRRTSDHSDHIHVALGINAPSKEHTMNRTDVITAELARLQDELAQRNVYGEDAYDDGTVLKFKANFNGDKSYTYAAVKAVGKWYLTTDRYRGGVAWSQLVDFFISANVTKMWRMAKAERIV